jgi:hypothetical protein
LKSFSENKSIKVYAYPENEFDIFKAKLAGEIIVLKNTEQHINKKHIVFFRVKSKNNLLEDGDKINFIGTIYDDEKNILRKALFQNLIIPSFEIGPDIDVSTDVDFIYDDLSTKKYLFAFCVVFLGGTEQKKQ